MHLEAVSAEAKWCTNIARSALARAVRQLARGHSCQALAREIAWRAVLYGDHDYASLEAAHLRAEAELEQHLEQALWNLECLALDSVRAARSTASASRAQSIADKTVKAAATEQVRRAYGRTLDSLIAPPTRKPPARTTKAR